MDESAPLFDRIRISLPPKEVELLLRVRIVNEGVPIHIRRSRSKTGNHRLSPKEVQGELRVGIIQAAILVYVPETGKNKRFKNR